MKVLWEIRDQGEEERRGHGLPGQGPLGCSLCSQTSPQAGEQLRACSPSFLTPHPTTEPLCLEANFEV